MTGMWRHGLFQDSEPEKGNQPPCGGLPLTFAQRDVKLPNPTAAASPKSVPEFVAVGIQLTTSLWTSVKGWREPEVIQH